MGPKQENMTWDLMEDMEKLQQHLAINKWMSVVVPGAPPKHQCMAWLGALSVW